METITNEKIIKFYSSKSVEDFTNSWTGKFEDNHMQSSGGYIDTAKAFIEKAENKEEEFGFYQWLLEKDHDNTLYNLESLKYLKGDNDFDIFLKSKKINQKWHCLIAWYARLEYDEKLTKQLYQKELNENTLDKTCIFKTQNKCPELRLWLVETAKEGKYITDKDVWRLKNAALIYTENKKNNLKQWNNMWKEYVKKLFQVIKAETC